VAFFVTRRRVWLYADWERKKIFIGGESRYSREALSREIAETFGEWSRSHGLRLEPALESLQVEPETALSTHL
jgi:hypothetical protein